MTISISKTGGPEALIRAKALELGFDVCGFTSVTDPWPASARLAAFVEAGRHGQMDWMADTLERRSHPKALWPGALSAIMLGVNYGPDHDPLEALNAKDRGNISVYAQGDDYHDLIKKRLKVLARWMVSQFGGQLKVFVDTAALMEKPLAQKSGLGWQGKHTISYLTIEHKGPVDEALRPAMGNRIYGCDDCLAVCPWNKFAQIGQEMALQPRPALTAPALADLAQLDDASFRTLFAKSPIKRIGRDRFVRNVLYAIGNSGEPALRGVAERLCADPDAAVADAARWAVARLD